MMKINTAFLFVSLFFINLSMAQPTEPVIFRVLANKGNNMINGKKLSTGQRLYLTDTIQTDSVCYIGLIDGQGQPYEINIPGTFTIKEMMSAFYKNWNPYFDPKLRPKPKPFEQKDYFDQGLVPENVYEVLFTPVTVFWCVNGPKYAEAFEIGLRNIFDDSLGTYSTKNNYLTIDLTRNDLHKEGAIVIDIGIHTHTKEIKYMHPVLLKKASFEDIDLSNEFNSASDDPKFWASLGDRCLKAQLILNACQAYFTAYQLSGNKTYLRKTMEIYSRNLKADSIQNCFKE